MSPRTAWLLVPLIAVAVWLAVRGRGDADGARLTRSTPIATNTGDPAPAGDGVAPPGDPAAPGRASRNPPPPVTSEAVTAGARPAGTTAPRPGDPSSPPQPAAAASPADPTRPGPTLPSGSDDDAPAGKLTDKTGWGDPSIGKQLNKEFMPLASECIDQAQARKPRLEGLLAFTMVVAPTENGRVLVASIKPRPDNQIADPELFECIRESSFALDALKAPHDFDITMPIKPEGSG